MATAAMATTPRMQRSAIPRTTQTQVLTLPAMCGPQQFFRRVYARRIAALLAERPRLAGLGFRRGAVSLLDGEPRQLHPGASVDPRLGRWSRSAAQVGERGVPLLQGHQGRTAFVAPERLFARNP